MMLVVTFGGRLSVVNDFNENLTLTSNGSLIEGNEQWSSQDLVDTLSMRLVSRFELLRTHAAEMAVAAR